MIKHALAIVGLTIVAILFAPAVELVLHWLFVILNYIDRLLDQVFATSQIGTWIRGIFLILAFTGLFTGIYAILNRLINGRLTANYMHVMWGSWIILTVTWVLKP